MVRIIGPLYVPTFAAASVKILYAFDNRWKRSDALGLSGFLSGWYFRAFFLYPVVICTQLHYMITIKLHPLSLPPFHCLWKPPQETHTGRPGLFLLLYPEEVCSWAQPYQVVGSIWGCVGLPHAHGTWWNGEGSEAVAGCYGADKPEFIWERASLSSRNSQSRSGNWQWVELASDCWTVTLCIYCREDASGIEGLQSFNWLLEKCRPVW